MTAVAARTYGIAQALHAAEGRLDRAGISDAPNEAEVLLMHALGVDRARLYAQLHEPLLRSARELFEGLLARRLAHEPSPYITGHREFYGLDLRCTPGALIPRQETELLVDLALDWIKASKIPEPLVTDVGTGSGAIAVAIAANAPQARVIATDTSKGALRLARENALRHGAAQGIAFVRGPLLEPLRQRANVILANLPYISDGVYESLPPEIREHEPQEALRAGPAGTECIEALLREAPRLLAPGGLLVAEHAWDQGASVREVARAAFADARIATRRDLAGLERALVVRTD